MTTYLSSQTAKPTGADAVRFAPTRNWTLVEGYAVMSPDAQSWAFGDFFATYDEAKAVDLAAQAVMREDPANVNSDGNLSVEAWNRLPQIQNVLIATDPDGRTFKARFVPADNAAKLERDFAKLVRRAEKLGIEAPELYRAGEVDKAVHVRTASGGTNHTQWFWQRYVVFAIVARPVRLDGYRLAGRIDHLSADDGTPMNLVALAPWVSAEGLSVSPEFRSSTPVCQHCNTARRRNNTYLVEKSGDIKQVGRNCLSDFCGDATGARLLTIAGWEKSFDGMMADALEEGGGSGRSEVWTTAGYLAWTAKSVRDHGWKSRGAVYKGLSYGPATADDALETMVRFSKQKGSGIEEPTEADIKRAEAAREWAEAIDENTESDYLWNLRVSCSMHTVPEKSYGIVASLFAAYDRAMSRIVEDKRRAEAAARTVNSDYLGEAGDKIGRKLSAADKRKGVSAIDAFDVEITFTKDIETDYGGSTIVKMLTDEGNVLSWFASSPYDSEDNRVEAGKRYSLVATIKGTGEFRGTKETKVNRCVLTPVA